MTPLLQIWHRENRSPTLVEKIEHSPNVAELDGLLDQCRKDQRKMHDALIQAAARRRAELSRGGQQREHSRKPDAVPARIDVVWPDLPKLELFARTTRPGWVAWGNEADRFTA